jgi:hypothetical protein
MPPGALWWRDIDSAALGRGGAEASESMLPSTNKFAGQGRINGEMLRLSQPWFLALQPRSLVVDQYQRRGSSVARERMLGGPRLKDAKGVARKHARLPGTASGTVAGNGFRRTGLLRAHDQRRNRYCRPVLRLQALRGYRGATRRSAGPSWSGRVCGDDFSGDRARLGHRRRRGTQAARLPCGLDTRRAATCAKEGR